MEISSLRPNASTAKLGVSAGGLLEGGAPRGGFIGSPLVRRPRVGRRNAGIIKRCRAPAGTGGGLAAPAPHGVLGRLKPACNTTEAPLTRGTKVKGKHGRGDASEQGVKADPKQQERRPSREILLRYPKAEEDLQGARQLALATTPG